MKCPFDTKLSYGQGHIKNFCTFPKDHTRQSSYFFYNCCRYGCMMSNSDTIKFTLPKCNPVAWVYLLSYAVINTNVRTFLLSGTSSCPPRSLATIKPIFCLLDRVCHLETKPWLETRDLTSVPKLQGEKLEPCLVLGDGCLPGLRASPSGRVVCTQQLLESYSCSDDCACEAWMLRSFHSPLLPLPFTFPEIIVFVKKGKVRDFSGSV